MTIGIKRIFWLYFTNDSNTSFLRFQVVFYDADAKLVSTFL